jgi:cytochrome c
MTRLQSTAVLVVRRTRRVVLLAVALAAGTAAAPARADDATIRYKAEPVGRGTVADKCVVCHSIEAGGPFRYAPNLHGIVGADKAREREWYGYSPALMTMGGVWTEEDLDRYLADADGFAPGTTKTIRIQDPEERRRIIEFLKNPNS